MNVTFVEADWFDAVREALFGSDDEYRRFQNFLMENPVRGDVILGTGGVRKTRWRDLRRGKGKRGGIRVAYLFVPEAALIILLFAYDKDTQDNLDSRQKRVVQALAQQMRGEYLEFDLRRRD